MSISTKSPCKVVTGKCVFSYLTVNEPKTPLGGGTPKYSVSLIIPKSDTVTVERITRKIRRPSSAPGRSRCRQVCWYIRGCWWRNNVCGQRTSRSSGWRGRRSCSRRGMRRAYRLLERRLTALYHPGLHLPHLRGVGFFGAPGTALFQSKNPCRTAGTL